MKASNYVVAKTITNDVFGNRVTDLYSKNVYMSIFYDHTNETWVVKKLEGKKYVLVRKVPSRRAGINIARALIKVTYQ